MRPKARIRTTILLLVVALLSPTAVTAQGGSADSGRQRIGARNVRFATFNASLNRGAAGQLIADLSSPDDAQAATVAQIIQRVQPDVLLINEFDYDADGAALRLFADNYLAVPQARATPIDYPYAYTAPSNTGIPTGLDLDNDGSTTGPGDAQGFGFFPGQFGMAVYSRYPILSEDIRTFQQFLWANMPGNLLPDDPTTPEPGDYYSQEERDVLRLSSKSHWDLPIDINGRVVHFLTAHPTPPVFDGPEDRNGRRNHDEIRLWADYIDHRKSDYIVDDAGVSGGLARGERFVIAGDYNADPHDGDSVPGAMQQLLESRFVYRHADVRDAPRSDGAVQQADLQGGANADQVGDPALDTADFADTSPGNLRVDYVLPSRSLRIRRAGVFWPVNTRSVFALVGTFPFPSSDHRLVWADIPVR